LQHEGTLNVQVLDYSKVKIEVKATHLGPFVKWVFPEVYIRSFHLVIVYTDEKGIAHYCRAGPLKEDANAVLGKYPLVTDCSYKLYRKGSVDWEPGAKSITVLTGKAAYGKYDCSNEEVISLEGCLLGVSSCIMELEKLALYPFLYCL
jgi:hypothetical protein